MIKDVPHVCERVDLDLPLAQNIGAAVLDRDEIVAEDSGRGARHGAGRALRVVVRIDCDAFERRHIRPCHLERIKLACGLEDRAGILRVHDERHHPRRHRLVAEGEPSEL